MANATLSSRPHCSSFHAAGHAFSNRLPVPLVSLRPALTRPRFGTAASPSLASHPAPAHGTIRLPHATTQSQLLQGLPDGLPLPDLGGGPPNGDGSVPPGGGSNAMAWTDEDDFGGAHTDPWGTLLPLVSAASSFWVTQITPTCARSGLLCAAAEAAVALAQGRRVDAAALRVKFLYGVMIKGVLMGLWYAALTALVPGAGLAAAGLKVALDMSVGNCVLSAAYLAGLPSLRGEGEFAALHNVSTNLVPTMLLSLQFWPLPCSVAMTLLPPAQQATFMLGCGFVYECVLGVTSAPAPAVQQAPACIPQELSYAL